MQRAISLSLFNVQDCFIKQASRKWNYQMGGINIFRTLDVQLPSVLQKGYCLLTACLPVCGTTILILPFLSLLRFVSCVHRVRV